MGDGPGTPQGQRSQLPGLRGEMNMGSNIQGLSLRKNGQTELPDPSRIFNSEAVSFGAKLR